MRKALGIVFLLLCATAPVIAQNAGSTGASITQTFDLKDLTNKPGKIVVGANVVTTLEFPANAVEVISGRPDLLIVQVSQVNRSRVLVRAAKTSGFTDLNISLATGETAIFSVNIDAKLSSSRRYIIKAASAAPAQANRPAAPAATTTSSSGLVKPPASNTSPASTGSANTSKPVAAVAAPVTSPAAAPVDSKPTTVLPAPDPKPAEPTPVASISGSADGAFDATKRNGLTILSLLPVDDKPSGADKRLPLPEWFGVYFRLTDINDGKRSASFEFTIENRGDSNIIADTDRLRVFVTAGRNRSPVGYKIADPNARATGPIMVKAQQNYSSNITLDRLPDDETNIEIVLEWTLGEEGSEATYMYRRSVQISLPPKAGLVR